MTIPWLLQQTKMHLRSYSFPSRSALPGTWDCPASRSRKRSCENDPMTDCATWPWSSRHHLHFGCDQHRVQESFFCAGWRIECSPSMPSRMRRASSLNVAGQCASHGSGSKSAISTAREDANGRRAHHGCSVEGCPCRIDFSRAACCDTSAIGKSTSAKRLQDLGIMLLDLATTGHGDGLAGSSYRRTDGVCRLQRFSCDTAPGSRIPGAQSSRPPCSRRGRPHAIRRVGGRRRLSCRPCLLLFTGMPGSVGGPVSPVNDASQLMVAKAR